VDRDAETAAHSTEGHICRHPNGARNGKGQKVLVIAANRSRRRIRVKEGPDNTLPLVSDIKRFRGTSSKIKLQTSEICLKGRATRPQVEEKGRKTESEGGMGGEPLGHFKPGGPGKKNQICASEPKTSRNLEGENLRELESKRWVDQVGCSPRGIREPGGSPVKTRTWVGGLKSVIRVQ